MRPERKRCGDCQECCAALSIVEIDKPAGEPCPHQCGRGCGIYNSRPKSCRDYKCVWLVSTMPMELRPDKCGVILEIQNTKLGAETLVARETRAGSVDAIWSVIEAAAGSGLPAYAMLTTGERRVIRQ